VEGGEGFKAPPKSSETPTWGLACGSAPLLVLLPLDYGADSGGLCPRHLLDDLLPHRAGVGVLVLGEDAPALLLEAATGETADEIFQDIARRFTT